MTVNVLVVEDSSIVRAILKRLLHHPPEVAVVGIAATGLEALPLLKKLKPDVVCTDLHMPQMNGLELTRYIMANQPTPILIISASVQDEDTKTVFELLDAGAVEIFPKPRIESASQYEALQAQLLQKVKVLAGVRVFTRRATSLTPTVNPPAASEPPSSLPPRPLIPQTHEAIIIPAVPPAAVQGAKRLVAIGSSTGGPQALKTILSALPRHFPVPIVCVQHISQGFLSGLLDWLSGTCPAEFHIAPAGEQPRPGVIYFPPEQFHLEIDANGCFHHSAQPKVDGHRPSVTVLFNSVAQYYRSAAIGILLTGMGRDGAAGLLKMYEAGALTIAQDEASCVVFGMPKEAIALGAARQILAIERISPLLRQSCPS
jgi:two-component system chemotaxis response regulator CheB